VTIPVMTSAEEQRREVAEVATPRVPDVPARALGERVLHVILVEQRPRRDVVVYAMSSGPPTVIQRSFVRLLISGFVRRSEWF
jgi:hypothetical protein